MLLTDKINNSQIEFGDYQTPNAFVLDVCRKLKDFYGLKPDIILEPTCGIGNFFEGIVTTFRNTRVFYGIEINSEYCKIASRRAEKNCPKQIETKFYNSDIFSFNFDNIIDNLTKNDSLLIIGNPPWVTNSQLTSIGSANLPFKSNFKGCLGLDSITGKGNFDIAEYILLLLLSEFANFDCTLAMLCKTVVAKNIIRDIGKLPFTIHSMDLFTFNAAKVFGVNCDAGLLVIRLGKFAKNICNVYDFASNEKIREFGWIDDTFYSNAQNLKSRSSIDGKSQFEWRQGVKHDCSKIMELKIDDTGLFYNKFGDTNAFQIGQYIFPLIKSSDIKTPEITSTTKYVIVPQKRVNADTSQIKKNENIMWEYLQKYDPYLSARKSVVYKNAPKYAIFGIGDYSFAKYKVGISGFYKKPLFTLINSDIPVMMDDTCYFLSFDNITSAVIALALLNSPETQSFLNNIVFLDAKRPYTKEVLQRIDFEKLSLIVDYEYIYNYAIALPSKYCITKSDYQNFRAYLNCGQSVALQFGEPN